VTEPIAGHVDREAAVLVFTDLAGSAHAFASVVEVESFLVGYLYRPWFLTGRPDAGHRRCQTRWYSLSTASA
jgi:hypothetical protein